MTEAVSRQSSSAYELQSRHEAARYDELSQSCQLPPDSTQLSDDSAMSLSDPASSALSERYKPSNQSFIEAQNSTPGPAGANAGSGCFEGVEDAAIACGSFLLAGAEAGRSRNPLDVAQAVLGAYNCFDKVDDAIGVCSD
jgi:hypothetical protein